MRYGTLIKRTLAVVLSCVMLVTCPTLNGKFLNSGYAMELNGESGGSDDLSGYSNDDIAFGDTGGSDESDGDSGTDVLSEPDEDPKDPDEDPKDPDEDLKDPDEDPKDPDEGQGDTGDGSGDSGLIPGSPDTDGGSDGTTGSGDGTSEEENGEPEELGEPEEEIIPEEELEPVLTFEFEENSEFIDVSPEDWNNSANTQLILLQGVSVNDEYGNPVYSVWVRDDGGFNIDAVWPNNVFEITYAASHPVTGEIFTATREVYRTLGAWAIAPMAAYMASSTSDLQSKLLTAQGGDIITLNGPIANFTISSDIELKAPNATAVNPVIIRSPVGQRHFNVSAGTITVEFENVVLDGEQNGGGIKITGATTKVTIKSAKIINCKWTTEGGGAIFYNVGGGELTISNCIIDNNTVIVSSPGTGIDASTGSGGGIYAHAFPSGIKLNLTNNTQITNNTATWGGGVYSDYVNMDSGAVSRNTANDDSGGGGPTGGGVLGVNLEMYGGEISYNKATGFNGANGGGVGLSSSLVLDGGKIIYNETNGSGGGVALCNNASRTMDIRSGSISNNIASAGGGISILYIAGGSSINISGGEINNNKANYINSVNGFGGGICVWGGSSSGYMTISGGTISGNEAVNDGGGIYTFSALTLNGGAITLNKTTSNDAHGGGIYAYGSDAKLTLNGGTISKNTSVKGGGIYTTNATANAILLGGTVAVNCKIDGNTATTSATGSGIPAVHGGGIYLANAGGKLTINHGSIINNKIENYNGHGGGVYMYSDTLLDMNGGEISHNTAVYNGGGVNMEFGTLFEMKGGEISDNAAKFGGGVLINKGTFTIENGEISGNEAQQGGGVEVSGIFTMKSGAKIAGNTAYNGGGVYIGTVMNDSHHEFIMEGGEISGNSAYLNGGGVHIFAGNLSPATFTMNNGKISSNTVSGDNTASGGGVYVSFNASFIMNKGEISKNTADFNGGGIYTRSPLTFNDGCIITLNKTTATNEAAGGGIYANGNAATLTLNGGTISKNTSVKGGGIYTTNATANAVIFGGDATTNCKVDGNIADGDSVQYSGSRGGGGGIYLANTSGIITFNYGEITNNKALSGFGGGVYLAGTLNMNGGGISGNEARDGGGVSMCAGTFTMNSGKISGNTATINSEGGGFGGGLYVGESSTFTMNAGEVSGNTATNGGGGACVIYSSTFTMKGGTIVGGNTAQSNGGGVYVLNRSAFTMNAGEVSGNTAKSNGGGVCVGVNGTFTMNSGEISGNTATDFGGGVYTEEPFVLNADCTITLNKTTSKTGKGGGIYAGGNSATLTLNGGTISKNESANGGGIYTTNATGDAIKMGGTATVNCKIDDNTATVGNGGGIYLANANGKLTLNYGSITNNKARDANNSGHGGGVYMASGTLFDMDGGKVSNNTATGNFGGGVYVGGKFTMNDGIVGGNKVITGETISYVKYGGGVYVANGGEFIMKDGEISANYTEAGGGGVYISNSGTFTMEDGEISGNESSTGGGVYVYGKFTMNKGTIGGGNGGNTAIGNGGGVYVANGGGKFIMNDGKISSNSTKSSGGGVYVFYSSEFTMNGGEISYNEANDGGGVSIFGSLFIMKNGKITNNKAGIGGGIIGGVINIVGSGPVYSALTIKGGEISNNEATVTYGGGVALSPGSTLTVEAGKISNNRATTDGGGIWTAYTDLGNVTVASGVIFSGNTAVRDFKRVSDDDALYASKISGTSWSDDKLPSDNRGQGYNNYDIAYTRVEVIFNKNHTDASGWTEANPRRIVVNYGDYIGVKPTDPTRSGYALHNWNTKSDNTDPGAEVIEFGTTSPAKQVLQTRTLTLYAQWLTTTVTVTFNSQGGTPAVSTATVNRGSKVTAPAPSPTKQYYGFGGWYKEPGCITLWNFDDPVNNDITLYAKWDGMLYLEEVPNLDYGTKDIPLWKQLFGLDNTSGFKVKIVNTQSSIWELTLRQTTIFAKNGDTMDGKLVFTKNNQIQGSTLYDATKTICANATGVGPTVTLNWNSLTDGNEILLQTGPEDGMKSNVKYQTVLTWTLVDKGRIA